MGCTSSVHAGPSRWLPYIEVASADAAAGVARAAGARIVNGPMDVPGGGRIAQLLDPHEVLIAVHSAAPAAAKGAPNAPEKKSPAKPQAAPAQPAAKPVAKPATAPTVSTVKPAAAKPAAAAKKTPAKKTPAKKTPAKKSCRQEGQEGQEGQEECCQEEHQASQEEDCPQEGEEESPGQERSSRQEEGKAEEVTDARRLGVPRAWDT